MPYKDPNSPQAKANMRKRNQLYYERHMEEEKQRAKDYRGANPDIIKEQKKRHTKKYLKRELARIVEWKAMNPEQARDAQRKYDSEHNVIRARKYKLEVIEAYGGRCVCCGEAEEAFLTIDHIYGKGHAERAKIGLRGVQFYRWLKKRGFPKDFYQLLCFNCNCAKGLRGKCPHETKIEFDVIGLAC